MNTFLTRPSSLPAQSLSPKWASSGPSDATISGTDRHAALEALIKHNDDSLAKFLPENEKEAVLWAFEYIKRVAPADDHEIISERKLEIKRGGGVVLEGTPDVTCGDVIFDLKWRRFDYSAQMAAYALGLMQLRGTDHATAHLLFGDGTFYEVLEFSRQSAERIVYSILDQVADQSLECRASKYCDWCSKKLSCEILRRHVDAVGQECAVAPLETLDLIQPVEVARALNMANAVTIWANSIKEKAKEQAERGMQIPGYTLRSKSAGREIDPAFINEVFSTLDLPSEDFLGCCKLSVSKLEKLYAEKRGLKPKEVKAELNSKLSDFLVNKPQITYLEKEN
tara:strand:+ start:277 stop:1293 length:1017 start_codon:yes stop_codon:yes gene_type:complete